MGGRSGAKAVGAHGSIGRQIFEQVEQLTANGGMKKLDAFKQLATSSGREVGTVAANYYRIARQRGVALQPRRRTANGRAGGSKRALAALMAAVNELSSAIERQQQEIAQLRKENGRMAELRRLLSV